jgi:glycosyltransferase involved in cell wall biosynthesis
MKVALVVHGRFHAFDLARELLARGHDVTVFTNYPGWAARRFGVPPRRVRSFAMHGVADRVLRRLRLPWDRPLQRLFGAWAAREVARERWDVIHCWSGVSRELLERRAGGEALTLLMRGSSHIRVQRRLLDEEAARVGARVERPGDWLVARESDEYRRADAIVVLSDFAARTFAEEGFGPERLERLPLGVETSAFSAPREVVDRRIARIRGAAVLRILYVGSVSYRKGVWDLVIAAKTLEQEPFKFRLVGPVQTEVRALCRLTGPNVTVHGPVPQHELPAVYADADLFLFPTIEDGFAMVLSQALASRLPVLTTAHSAGPELVHDGVNGWIVPIRRPDRIVDRLRACAADREGFARMVGHMAEVPSRDWTAVAADFEALVERRRPRPGAKGAA